MRGSARFLLTISEALRSTQKPGGSRSPIMQRSGWSEAGPAANLLRRRASYQDLLRLHIGPLSGERALSSIRPENVKD